MSQVFYNQDQKYQAQTSIGFFDLESDFFNGPYNGPLNVDTRFNPDTSLYDFVTEHSMHNIQILTSGTYSLAVSIGMAFISSALDPINFLILKGTSFETALPLTNISPGVITSDDITIGMSVSFFAAANDILYITLNTTSTVQFVFLEGGSAISLQKIY